MKIYNQDKTELLENPDLSKGWLRYEQVIVNSTPQLIEGQAISNTNYEYETVAVYIPYTEEDLKANEIFKLEERLFQLNQDIIQMYCGAVFEDADERVAEFQEKHNRLRYLKGKEPREYK